MTSANPPDQGAGDAAGHPMDRPALLAALRARVARGAHLPPTLPLCAAIDQGLPGGGLARAAAHEVLAADPGAAAGFCAMLLARAARPLEGTPLGAVVWIAAEPEAWPPGLARFGLSPADLVLVRAPHPDDGLWAMEESLRCPGVAGALLVLPELDLTAARRLQLAAEAGGAIGLLLRPDSEAAGDSAALTRWRVGALAGAGTPLAAGRTLAEGAAHGLGDPRWQLDLLRCRGGRPQSWRVVWKPAAERLELDHAEGLEMDAAEQPGTDFVALPGSDPAAETTPGRARRRRTRFPPRHDVD
ncbi:ImuA family protein [Siccirubricoccus sp. G192]|uniref:ImuA family protein n=1 Tax=Siccirubricoccus sp. G192 TaxID=2849651 RepID=UPI001C2C058D|nr:hypothetical protein [Siccirubricoccus sp. G192]MBV1798961.1 hypothetical protein [Siccirubricoccus sp. G192]